MLLNLESLKGFSPRAFENKGSLLEKRYGLKHISVKSTHYHYWRQKGFVDTVKEDKWTSLNVVDCIWINMLTSMKNFGCSTKTMEWVHKALFKDAYYDNLSGVLGKQRLDHYQQLQIQRPLTPDEATLLAQIWQTEKDELLKMHLRREISYLYHMILEILDHDADAGILIKEDGTCERYIFYPDEVIKGLPQKTDFPQMRLPVAYYLKDFISEESRAELLQQDGLLTENELWVIQAMRNHKIRSLKIHFAQKDHAIEKIELEEAGLLSTEKSREVMTLLGMKNYSKIELNTRDGQSISFTRTTKKYLQ